MSSALIEEIRLLGDPDSSGAETHRLLRSAFFSVVQALSPTVFFDIGTRDGETACHAKELLPNCSVHAFEANPYMFGKYRSRIHASGVVHHNLAIGNTTGETELYVPLATSYALASGDVHVADEPQDTGRSSLFRRNDALAQYDVKRVPIITLDDYCDRAGINKAGPVVMWIDVEGAASLVLDGATETLQRTKVVFLEVETSSAWLGQACAPEVLQRLVDSGFTPIARDREWGALQWNVMLAKLPEA
ncbi:MAG: FkbM family methyltransferase [Hyphomicrobium sp.]